MKLNDLPDPDICDGETVEHEGVELKIYSTLSTRYNDYLALAGRQAARGAVDIDTPEGTGRLNREGAAHLVAEWNLDDELTIENAAELFRRSPKLLGKVQTAASVAAVRLGKKPADSKNTP